MAAQDPLVAVSFGGGAHEHRIGAGELGLGHGEAAPDLTADERHEETLFLRVRAVVRQNIHVGDVRRLTVEAVVPQGAAPQLLGQVRELREAQPSPAQLLRNVRRKQPHLPNLVPHHRQLGHHLPKALVLKPPLQRQNLLDQKRPNHLQNRPHPLRQRKLQNTPQGKGDVVSYLALSPAIHINSGAIPDG